MALKSQPQELEELLRKSEASLQALQSRIQQQQQHVQHLRGSAQQM